MVGVKTGAKTLVLKPVLKLLQRLVQKLVLWLVRSLVNFSHRSKSGFRIGLKLHGLFRTVSVMSTRRPFA
jgi:hypothetical protein